MDFNLYGDDSKGVIKLDPRTKMVVLLSSAILSINSYNDLAQLLYGVALCLLLGLCGRRSTALKAFVAFAVAIYLRWCVEVQGTGTEAGILLCQLITTLFLFAFPFMVAIVLLIRTTRISQFLASFQAMHLPTAIVIPVAVMFRFIPTVQDEWAGIRKAMAFRGIELNLGSVALHPLRSIENMLVPMLFSSMAMMEELAAAALARGLEADNERTSYEDVRLQTIDYAIIAVFSGLCIYVLASPAIEGMFA